MQLSDDVPDAVREILVEYRQVWRPDMELPMEVKVMYDRGDAGHCMTCGTPVGEHATAVVNEFGWALLYCGQACLQDMIIANYLADQYGNINEEIKQRGDNRE